MSRDVYNELMSSESRYLSCLQVLSAEYVSPVLSRVNPRHLQELQPLFSLLSSLLSLHARLLPELTARPALSSLFLRHLPALRVYLQYAEAHGRGVRAVHVAMGASKKFRAAVEKAAAAGAARTAGGAGGGGRDGNVAAQSAVGGGAASELLLLLDAPLQRLPQYCLYVRDMQEAADTAQEERSRLLQPLAQLEDIAAKLRQMTGKAAAPHSAPPLHTAARAAGGGGAGVVPLTAPAKGETAAGERKEPLAASAAASSPPVLSRPNSSGQQAGGAEPVRRRLSLPVAAGSGPLLPHPQHALTAANTPDRAALPATPDPPSLNLQSPLSPPFSPPSSGSSSSSPQSTLAALSPASSSSSSAAVKENPIFRYIPRIVLQRFLTLDAALHRQTAAGSASASASASAVASPPRPRAALSLSHYLPSASSAEVHTHAAAAILVADVSGFTKLNESFSVMDKGAGAEQVTTHLNRYFSSLLNIINSHGGDCVKFAGDALIVLFLPSRDWRGGEDAAAGGAEEAAALSPPLSSSSSASQSWLEEHREQSQSSLRLTEEAAHDAAAPLSRLQSSPQFRFPHSSADKSQGRLRDDTGEACLRAVQCALQLQQDVGVYHASLVDKEVTEGEGAEAAAASASSLAPGASSHRRSRSEASRTSVELALHIAIGCGPVHGFHVGGWEGEYEFVLTGSAFGQLMDGLDLSKRGEVVVSRPVWELIERRCVGQPCSGSGGAGGGRQMKLSRSGGEVRVSAVSSPIPLCPLPSLPFRSLSAHPFIPQALRAYVPRSVLDMLDLHGDDSYGWLSEIRTVTVIFCNLRGLLLNRADSGDPALTQRCCSELQRVIARNQGYRRQFLVDDKGTTLIVVFGVPPFAHEDDAYRGVKCAIEMRDVLLALRVAHGMGITTGVVYSGSVGSPQRQEHAVVGDIVNAAARIAGKAEATADGCILLDAATHEQTKVVFEMKAEGELAVKGKQSKIRVYSPVRVDRLAVMGTVAQKTTGETLNRGQEMAEFMQALQALLQQGQSKLIFIEGEAGIGKCFAAGTELRLYDGGTVRVEDVKGGERLMGPDSLPRTVTPGSLTLPGSRGVLFRIQPTWSGAAAFTVNADHILVLLNRCRPAAFASSLRWFELHPDNRGAMQMRRRVQLFPSADSALQAARSMTRHWQPLQWEVTVADFCAASASVRAACRLMAAPLVTFHNPRLPSLRQQLAAILRLEPTPAQLEWTAWQLGFWLVDATSRSRPELARRLDLHQRLFGEQLTAEAAACVARRLLESYGLEDNRQRVPQAWLCDSADVRRSILAGVVDGAGRRCRGKRQAWDISCSARQSLEGCKLLAASLGLVNSGIRQLEPADRGYSLTLAGSLQDVLQHSAAVPKPGTTRSSRGVSGLLQQQPPSYRFKVRRLAGLHPYYGFAVSGGRDRRFLLSDFTVSHNTHLIRNFYRVVSTNLHTLHVVYAKGDATESTSVLSLWTAVLEQMMALPAPAKGGAMVAKRTRQVHKFLKQVVPSGQSSDPRLPFLNLVLMEPVNLPDNELTRATKGQTRQIVKQAENIVYYVLANALAHERKQGKHTVLFAEDVQLMDASSLEVLKKVATSIRPLLLVCSARPPPRTGNTGGGGGGGGAAVSATRLSGGLSAASGAVGADDRAGPGTGVSSRSGDFSSPEVSCSSGDEVERWTEEKEAELAESSSGSSVRGLTELQQWKLGELDDAKAADTPLSSPEPSVQSAGAAHRSASSTSSSSSSASAVSDSSVWAAQYASFLKLPSLHHIVLSGLNQTTCTRLVCQRLHAMSLDPQLSSLIFKRSRGNPLYAVEVASHLLENGFLLLRHDGHCLVNPNLKDREGRLMTVDAASLDLPMSLKGLVTRRLDSLPKRDLLVCKLASAFGYEELERETLLELCRGEGLDEAQVQASIQALEAANILAVRGGGGEAAAEEGRGGVTLYFQHELVHSACYDLLVMSQKLRLHFRLAQLELRRAQRTHNGAGGATAQAEGDDSGSSGAAAGESDPVAAGAAAAKPESFARRLLRRKRGSMDLGAGDVALASSPASSPSPPSSSLPALSGAELKRRASTLTYHYTMAVKSYTAGSNSGSESGEMRQFIREAKDYLAQRLIHVPDEGAEAAAGSRNGHGSLGLSDDNIAQLHSLVQQPDDGAQAAATSPPPPPPPPPPHASPQAFASWAEPAPSPVSGSASQHSSARPPPAPLLHHSRRSWSGRIRPPPPPITAAAITPPVMLRSITTAPSSRGPPPLPPAAWASSPASSPSPPHPPVPHSPGPDTAAANFSSAVRAAVAMPSLDSPARVWQGEPPPTSTSLLPATMSPTAQSPHAAAPSPLSASLSPSSSPFSASALGPPPLPFLPAGTDSIHVSVAQLYAALASAGLAHELKERVVASLLSTSRHNYIPASASTPTAAFAAAAAFSPPPLRAQPFAPPPLTAASSAYHSKTPPPLPHSLSASYASPSPQDDRMPRSHSDVSSSRVEEEEGVEQQQPAASAASSSSPPRSPGRADLAFHRAQPPDSPLSAEPQPQPSPQPQSPHSEQSAASASSPSRSPSFPSSVAPAVALDRPPPIPSPQSVPSSPLLQQQSASSSAAAEAEAAAFFSSPLLVAPPLAVAIDSLVKLHREDVLWLRSLSKQSREPPAAARRVVETVAALVTAVTRASAKGRNSRAAAAVSKPVSWRELLSSSALINTLVKCSPLSAAVRPPGSSSAPQSPAAGAAAVSASDRSSLSAEAEEGLRTAVNDPIFDKPAFVRSLSPPLRVLWGWVLAVCREYGVVISGSAATPDSQTTAAAASAQPQQAEADTAAARTAQADEADARQSSAPAVRTRSRSRSMELIAPVSPPPEPAATHESPSAQALAVKQALVRPSPPRRSITVPARRAGSMLARDQQTLSPHSADARAAGGAGAAGGGGGGSAAAVAGSGRGRVKRESASTRSSENVHLSVSAALKVRRKSLDKTEAAAS